jgi:branched-chain amino acid transport system substrate-binding protein
MRESKSTAERHGSTRRRFLGIVGATGVATLAGCSDDGDNGNDGNDGSDGDNGASDGDGEDGEGDGGSDGTSTDAGASDLGSTTVGILSPLSGPFSSLGPGQRDGAELAVQRINDSDEYSVEMERVVKDTQTEPAAAQQSAQQVVQQDGAEYIVGGISSSVALGLNEFAAAQEVVSFPGAAAVRITGRDCNEWVFRTNAHTAQTAAAISAYTVNNLGTNVWFHIADYAYGDSVYNRVRERMQAANDQFTEVGKTASQLGASNFESFISQINNSEADVAVLGMTGGDLINFVAQAANAGLKDEVTLVSPTMTFQVVRRAAGNAALDTYGAVRYLPDLDTDHNRTFVEAYRNAYDATPDVFARDSYDALLMLAQAMEEIGTIAPSEIKDELAGRPLSTVFGDVQFRPCDHQAENPTWMGRLVEGDGDVPDVELLDRVEGSANLPPCSELGCNLG